MPKWLVVQCGFLVIVIASLPMRWRPDWPVIAVLAYAGASLLWSEDWRRGALSYPNWLALAAIYWGWRRWGNNLSGVMTAALVVVLVAAAAFPHYGGFGNENFIAEWVIAALPLSAACCLTPFRAARYARCALPSMASLAAIAYLAFFNDSKLEIVALASFFVCYCIWKRWYAGALILVLAFVNLLLIYPEIFPAWAIGSMKIRIEFAVNTFAMWWDAPLFGHGLGSFDYVYPAYERFHETLWPNWGQTRSQANFAGAAHNEALQALSELGCIGTGLCLLGIWKAYRSHGTAMMPLWILAGLSLVGFPLQNPATAVVAVICLAELSKAPRSSSRRSRLYRPPGRSMRMWRSVRPSCTSALARLRPSYTTGEPTKNNRGTSG